MSVPLVSICIPTYNGARYLSECFDSILCQSFHDFEIIVVDDQSSDGTVGIVEEYIQRDKRIKLFCNEKNVGLVNNWNRCIELSQGEWVKYVFQDDLIAPTCLERMLQARYDDVPFVVCARSFIYEENIDQKTRQWFDKVLTLRKLFPLKHVVSNVEFIEASVRNPKINFVGEPTTTLLKRDIFFRFGVFNHSLIQTCDLEFWIRVACNTGLVYVDEDLAKFRIHKNSVSHQNFFNRIFRGGICDWLILLHEYNFNPAYEPLRMIASQKYGPTYLKLLLSYFCREAKKSIIRSADSTEAKADNMREWCKLVSLYPAIGIFSSPNFLLAKRMKERFLKLLKLHKE